MKCDKCGKEFQTYRGICPYCHNKNEKDTREQPTVKYTPIAKPNPPVYEKPKNPTENIRSQSPVKNSKSPDKTFRYALMGGIALLVVLSVGAMAQSFLGESPPPSGSAPEIHVTPEETIPPLYTTSSTQPKITYSGSKAGTLSPYSVDPNSITPDPYATRYIAPIPQNTQTALGDALDPQNYIPLSIDGFSSNDGISGPIDNSNLEGGTTHFEIMYHLDRNSKYYAKFDYLIIQVFGFTDEGSAERIYQELYKCEQPLTLAGRQVTYEFDRPRGQTNICWRDKNNVILVGTGPFDRNSANEQAQKEANIYAATLVLGGSPAIIATSIPTKTITTIPTTVPTSIPTSIRTTVKTIPTTITTISTTVPKTGVGAEISLNSWKQIPGPGGAYPHDEHYRFIEVNFTFRNNWYDCDNEYNKKGLYFVSSSVYLIDEGGFAYHPELSLSNKKDSIGLTLIPVGGTLSGKLIFEVYIYDTKDTRYQIGYNT